MDIATDTTESRRVRFFKGSANEQARRASRQMIGTAAFLAVCMWSFIGWSVWADYEQTRQTAQVQERNLIAALANELTLSFDSSANALRLVRNEIDLSGPSGRKEAIQARLERTVRDQTELGRDVQVAGPDGKVLFSTLPPDPASADLSGQPHFVRHRTDASAGLVIEPTGEAAARRIAVSMRLAAPDGRFTGEASVLLPPDRLLTLHREIDLGQRGIVAVTGPDGIVIAGFDRDHPDGSAGTGTDLGGAPFPSSLAPGETAFYNRVSKIDGVERLTAIRRLPRYDLNVLVGRDRDDVLASTRAHARLVYAVGSGATLLFVILTLLLVREVWRRTRREIELAADRERLQLAQRQIEVERSRLAETNRELLASKERAEVANKTKSQFLAHMSHELRTPLHAIIGFSELIRDQGTESEATSGYASDILTSGRHLLELINTILDISKIESGTATLSETTFPVDNLIRSAMVTVKAQADARHITLEPRLPTTPVRLFADRTRLLQVLINLLGNAVKFTPDDGKIVVSVALNPAGEAIISVIDSGIGMSEAELQVALQPFGQVDSALSRTFGGTGLGLPLAARLTELHNGRLELTSIKGRGTAARVTLPAKRIARRAGATAA